jgi:hypothetical protein
MGLFGHKHPNFDRVAYSISTQLGLSLAKPAEEVMKVLDEMTGRELVAFDNMHSVEGLQELFRSKSLRAFVDPAARTITLALLERGEIEAELKIEHARVKVLQVAERQSRAPLVKPAETVNAIGSAASARPSEPVAPLPKGFEHLEPMERMCPVLVDVFVRHGQLNTGDKEVLRKIKPIDSSIEARVVALERWQAELTRRIRALSIPKPTRHILLGEDAEKQKPEETLARRFDALVVWLGKLIKAFEATGIKYHNKPVWLPH